MPKIIENLESRLLEETGKQIETVGYSAMTVRSVAKACGVGVGTVYNYFPSKEDLLAAFLLQDWKLCVAEIRYVSESADDPEPVARCIFTQLIAFAERHSAIFRDPAAASGFAGSFSRYHGLLRSQLAQPLRKYCSHDFAAEFVAEALLTWSMAGRAYEEVWGMVQTLFR